MGGVVCQDISEDGLIAQIVHIHVLVEIYSDNAQRFTRMDYFSKFEL